MEKRGKIPIFVGSSAYSKGIGQHMFMCKVEEIRCDWVSSQLTYKGTDLQLLPGWKKQPDLSCSVARPECSDNLKRFHPDTMCKLQLDCILLFFCEDQN